MDAAKFSAEQKEFLEKAMTQAQAYTNLIMLAGYAGLFALWQVAKEHLTPLSAYMAGILLIISLAVFIAMEIYGMYLRSKDLFRTARAVDDPESYIANVARHREDAANRAVRLAQLHPYGFFTSIVSGGGAALIILLAFCHGLWIATFGKVTPMEYRMIETILPLIAGALIAGIVGFIFVILLQRSNARRTRHNLARSLADELRTASGLYADLRSHWKEERWIWFRIIDEMIESRVDYQNARPHLGILADSNLQARISAYYRKTAFDIDALKPLERDRSNIQELISRAPAEQEKAKGTETEEAIAKGVEALPERLRSAEQAIEAKLETFESHSATALQLAALLDRL